MKIFTVWAVRLNASGNFIGTEGKLVKNQEDARIWKTKAEATETKRALGRNVASVCPIYCKVKNKHASIVKMFIEQLFT